MALTTAQIATLKAAIAADQALAALPNNSESNVIIAAAFNAPASPAFTVWKTNVTIGEAGRTFNASELAGLTSLNTQRLQNLAAWMQEGINPSVSTVRQFFDDIFSGAGGANTRTALLALWKRTATRAEKLFATGTGSDPSPASVTFEGVLTPTDIDIARNS